MKIPSIAQIREADTYTIQNEPISSIDLMERSASLCAKKIMHLFDNQTSVVMLCGMGNNGGDGLAMARILWQHDYTCEVYVVKHSQRFSEDCAINLERLKQSHAEHIHEINQEADIPCFHSDLIVDAILGSGLNKAVTNSLLCALFKQINQSAAFVFSVDIPSGFFAEKPMDPSACCVKADFVFSFQFPKLAFLFPENYVYVGEWEVGDIGLHPDMVHQIETPFYYVEEKDIQSMMKPRHKFSHKGHFGHALIIAGSKGMMGAAVLAAKACLRSGAGIVEMHIPEAGYQIMQTCVNEALCSCDEHKDIISHIKHDKLLKATAIAVGPGLGTHPDTAKALNHLIKNTHIPLVFDADAINCIAENKTWLEFIPPNSIFTPHPKEFERLVGKTRNSFDRLNLQREFSNKYQCIIVLKGAHSCVSMPDGKVFFNSSGNPGMASGGSGDVLTGIITGLLAQGYHPTEAAVMGVYLHGKAGDMALSIRSVSGLLASDIIEALSYIS